MRSKCLQSLHELTISTKNRVSKLVYSHSLPIPIVSPLEGTRTTPDYLVNRVLTKNKGPHPKNLYRNREIVVEWKVGVWEKGQLTRVEMGWVLQPIQTLKEYFHVTSVALTLVPLGTLVRSPWFFPTKIIFIQKHFSPMTGWGSGHLRSPALRNDPGTVTIPQYRFNKTKQHTGRGSGYPRSPALRNDPGNVTITNIGLIKTKQHTLFARCVSEEVLPYGRRKNLAGWFFKKNLPWVSVLTVPRQLLVEVEIFELKITLACIKALSKTLPTIHGASHVPAPPRALPTRGQKFSTAPQVWFFGVLCRHTASESIDWFWLPIFRTNLVRGLWNKATNIQNKGEIKIAPLFVSQPRNQN